MNEQMKETRYDAPDMDVQLSDGTRMNLSSFWQGRPVALVFLRHFGCPFARRQVTALRRDRDALSTAAIAVVLVGSGSPEKAEPFRQKYDVPFPIVCDPDCVLYKQYGLQDMKVSDFLSPSILLKTVAVLAQGYGHKSSQGPERQLPGSFIIDRGGIVRFSHQAVDATYNVSAEEIIRAAATLA